MVSHFLTCCHITKNKYGIEYDYHPNDSKMNESFDGSILELSDDLDTINFDYEN